MLINSFHTYDIYKIKGRPSKSFINRATGARFRKGGIPENKASSGLRTLNITMFSDLEMVT